MHVWNVLNAARRKYRTQKLRKKCHLHTVAQLCRAIATKACIDNRKKWLNANISSTCLHNMMNFGPLAAPVGGFEATYPSKFQPVSRLGFVTAPTSLNGGQPNFARCLAVSCAGTIYIFFPGLMLHNGQIYFASKSCVILYWHRYCTTLEQWASAKLCDVGQGMELRNFRSPSFWTEGATYITRATITLSTGAHSGLFCVLHSITIWLSIPR